MNNTFFSIVIPVYNTPAKFLEQCFNSVNNQSYKNYEVIVVDDGSESDTVHFLSKYSIEFKILHQKTNMGIVVARKTGVEAARGDYVLFLDSDDILDHDALNKLNNIINKTSADVIMAQTPKFTDDINFCMPVEHYFLPEGEVQKEEVLSELLRLHINSIADKVAKRELLDFSDDNLDETIINGEDLQQSTALILKSHKFYYTHEVLCYYRINISGRTYYDITKINDINYMVPPYRMVFENSDNYKVLLPEYKKACVNSIIYNVFCIYEAKLSRSETYSLLNKVNNLEITKIMSNIKEKINFPSEFVFSLFRNKHYFLLGMLANFYPIQH